MDTKLEDAIKRAEKNLQELRDKKKDAVFHCSVCGGDFENLMNYRELGMCGACYTKTKTEELKKHVEQLIGATIVDIQIAPADPMWAQKDNPEIVEITVKTADGKIVKIKKPPEVCYIL
jgi:hypothetical protein